MIDDDAAKGTKEIEQPAEKEGEFISSVVLCVVTRQRIDTVCIGYLDMAFTVVTSNQKSYF